MVEKYVKKLFIVGYCFLLEEYEILGICFEDMIWFFEWLCEIKLDYLYVLLNVYDWRVCFDKYSD